MLGVLSGCAARIDLPLRSDALTNGSRWFENFYYVRSGGAWYKSGSKGADEYLTQNELERISRSPQTLWESNGFEQEPTLAVAARYFQKDLPATAIPTPLTQEFWRVYQEPVTEWLHWASVFAESVKCVSDFARKKFEREATTSSESGAALEALRIINWYASHETAHYEFGPFVIERRRSAMSLLAILSKMFLLDLEAGRRLIRCATCDRFFVSNDRKAKYCKVACRNLAQTRRYRARKKGINDGKTWTK